MVGLLSEIAAEVLDIWPAGQEDLKRVFSELAAEAEAQPETRLSLVSRPGVSYSLRAGMEPSEVNRRPVYLLVDVVVSKVDPWFLSVCFYEDQVEDIEELGELIPNGLLEEDGYCFDVDGDNPELTNYLRDRIREAYRNGRA